MIKDVKISSKARKQLKHIHPDDARKILIALKKLAETEVGLDIKALVRHQYDFRLRVGNYRVLFDKTTGTNQIFYEIHEVKHRREAY
jgi:mRNA-degrading endonuclease RelE of RelBE toxin-antitoxin system